MFRKFSFFLAMFFLLPQAGFGWGGMTHRKITSDAYYIMPKAFREFLGETSGPTPREPNLKALLAASLEPDLILKDFRNHVFHVQGYDLGNGPFHVEGLAKEIAEDIKSKAPLPKIVQKLGWIAHYIEDLAQPLHTGVATWEGIEEKSYHSAYEKAIDRQIYSFGVYFDGAQPITRISARMVYEALWANQYYTTIEAAYTGGNNPRTNTSSAAFRGYTPHRGDRYEAVKDLSGKCYSRAVNNVVDIWYSIWVMAGGKQNPNLDGNPKYYPPYWRKYLSPPLPEFRK